LNNNKLAVSLERKPHTMSATRRQLMAVIRASEVASLIATLGAALAIELLARIGIIIPVPMAVLLAVVVVVTSRHGLRAGIVSAAIAWLYHLLFLNNGHESVVWLVVLAVVIAAVAHLRNHPY
jgi:hypothetical protein